MRKLHMDDISFLCGSACQDIAMVARIFAENFHGKFASGCIVCMGLETSARQL